MGTSDLSETCKYLDLKILTMLHSVFLMKFKIFHHVCVRVSVLVEAELQKPGFLVYSSALGSGFESWPWEAAGSEMSSNKLDWRNYRKSRNHKSYERVSTGNTLETTEWNLSSLRKSLYPTLMAKTPPHTESSPTDGWKVIFYDPGLPYIIICN